MLVRPLQPYLQKRIKCTKLADTKKAMTFTGYRSKSSIGISFFKVKRLFQDNGFKVSFFLRFCQIFYYQKNFMPICVPTHFSF